MDWFVPFTIPIRIVHNTASLQYPSYIPHVGKTWFVRPAGGSYGLENGASYADAWDGLLNIVWGVGGVEPGDDLFVCGLHLHSMVSPANPGTQADINLISGTPGNRITIRGDCTGDPGIVWGAHKIVNNPGTTYDNWTDEGDGAWSVPLRLPQFGDWYFQDVGVPNPDSFIVLDAEKSIQGVKDNLGSHFSVDYVQGSLLYISMTDGGDPTGRVTINTWGYQFIINGKEHVTFLHLVLPNFVGSIVNQTQPKNMTWSYCKMSYGRHTLVRFEDFTTDIEISDCEISWANNGIYHITTTNDAPKRFKYLRNFVHHIGFREINFDLDSHSIACQGGEDGLIQDNTMQHAGTGVTLYAFGDGIEGGIQILKNILVKGNTFTDGHTRGGAEDSRGFDQHQDNDSLSDKSNIVFDGNTTVNVEVGYRSFAEAPHTVTFINNRCDRARIGFQSLRNYLGTIGSSVAHSNNTYTNITELFIDMRTSANEISMQSDNNSYLTGTPDVGFFWLNTELTFGEWQALTGVWTSDPISFFDPNSIHVFEFGDAIGSIDDLAI